MKLQIKRIAPISLAGTLGTIYFIIGCVTSVIGFLISATGARMTFNSWFSINFPGGPPVVMLLLNPFIAAIGGYITGLLIAVIYNFVSRFTRGVIIETEETDYFI